MTKQTTRQWVHGTILVGVAALVGCATPPPPPVAPVNPAVENQLRVGDDLQVRLAPSGNRGPGASEPEIYNVTIDENGDISLPLVGRIPATGTSSGALAERIEANYVPRYYVRCNVSVTVSARFFYVGGEVRAPGRFNWTEDMTLLKAINTAGSFTDYANRSRVEITRGKQKITADGEQLLRDPSKDIPIRPGDSIWVPRSIF